MGKEIQAIQPNEHVMNSSENYVLPADDPRYTGFAAIMNDGREFTDYRQPCQTRVEYGLQAGVKRWLVGNTDSIIKVSRDRQGQNSGHFFGLQNLSPSAKIVQVCDPMSCKISSSDPSGLGIERSEQCPELFGTFQGSPNSQNIKNIGLNVENYGGRNTPLRWQRYFL
jgi:hypothetical protein